MESRRVTNLLFFTICWGLLLWAVVNSEPVHHYVSALKGNTATKVFLPFGDEDRLRKQIEEWKREKDQPPVDAKVDRVWRAIPGYNGRTVDVEATLAIMKRANKPTPEQIVYKQITPERSLLQLGPHPIYRGNPHKPAVSFMVNVAWGNEHLDKILNTLDAHGVKTTFFLDGSWVRKYPDYAKKIASRGHEIGNHAYSHPDMSKLSNSLIVQELNKTQQIIKETVGVTPTMFAPPSGSYNQEVVKIARNQFDMLTILWTADTVDWKKPPVDTMVKSIGTKLGNGVLILMHPTESSANGLDQMLRIAKQKGLLPTTVSDVLSSDRVDVPVK